MIEMTSLLSNPIIILIGLLIYLVVLVLASITLAIIVALGRSLIDLLYQKKVLK
jgi:hypothetical protein